MLGNHLPRRCGIATFTTDLRNALASKYSDADCFVLAMNDARRRHAYPDAVRFELAESDITAYRRAADFLNVNAVDVLSVQHEFGIFGGKAGAYLLAMLREVRTPVVTTLHTVLPEPNPPQLSVMLELGKLSERIVVMSERAIPVLESVYQVPKYKIDFIPHGIPVAPAAARSKYRLGIEGKLVMLTFGLLSPDKGIEHVIDALPAIIQRFPNVLYIVVGATHPHVKDHHGETYRLALEQRAQRLGVDSHVLFHDRFVSPAELAEFMAAADIYVTPYLNAEQVTSGTLAYAVGFGKAVISTPYAYAREMLAQDRGIIVPWRDPAAIAREAIALFQDDQLRAALGSRAAAFGANMVWPSVAEQYYDTFSRAREGRTERQRAAFQAKPLAKRPVELPETNLEHIRCMTDSTGILQHARFNVPRYEDGYCLDDNARALLLTAVLEDMGAREAVDVRGLASSYLAFVNYAFDHESGRFRNFMNYDRRWNEVVGSEDSHGRAVWALGAVVGRSSDPSKQSLAGVLFQRALTAVPDFSSVRAWAFGLLGISEYLRAFQGDSSVQLLRDSLAERLFAAFERRSSVDWPWCEDTATYENARVCQALLSAAAAMKREEMIKQALRSLEWLVSVQGLKDSDFSPIGSNGFYEHGKPKAMFDQQPLEAWAMVSACLEARLVTGEERWAQHARRALGWFLGQNHLQQPLYDATTGGCRDGLHVERANENQGAESTLSFQLALLEMRGFDLTPVFHLVAQGATNDG